MKYTDIILSSFTVADKALLFYNGDVSIDTLRDLAVRGQRGADGIKVYDPHFGKEIETYLFTCLVELGENLAKEVGTKYELKLIAYCPASRSLYTALPTDDVECGLKMINSEGWGAYYPARDFIYSCSHAVEFAGMSSRHDFDGNEINLDGTPISA